MFCSNSAGRLCFSCLLDRAGAKDHVLKIDGGDLQSERNGFLRGLSLLFPVLVSLGRHRMLTLMKGQTGTAKRLLAQIAPFGMGRAE